MRPILILSMLLTGSASAQFFPGQGAVSQPNAPTAPAAPGSNTSSTATPSGVVALPSASQGIPPTPAPAFPGLPVPSTSGPPSGTPVSPLAQDLRTQANLTPSQIAEMQSLLSAQGLYRGPIDGIMTGSTRAALRAYQEAARIPTTGQADAATAAALGVSSPVGAAANFPPFALSNSNQSAVFIQP